MISVLSALYILGIFFTNFIIENSHMKYAILGKWVRVVLWPVLFMVWIAITSIEYFLERP